MIAASSVAIAAPVARHDPEHDRAIRKWLDEHLPRLVSTYKRLHAHPELSFQETKTAALVAERLRAAGAEVADGVGKTGVVGVVRNSAGPTLLVRGDMDALPVTEETGLEYGSQVTVQQPDGTRTGVMHACGHDVHTTALVGIAELLRDLRDRWRGTVVFVAQPAEEIGKGAAAMIEDGLLERFPRPDLALALHVSHELAAGTIGFTPGAWAANVDSVDIVVRGRGGHGARPHETVDPVVTAAYMVTALQTLVSRRVDPVEPAVVTVGSIHAGTKHNVIPDSATMALTVRSFSDDVRKTLLDGVEQIAKDTCRTFRCPEPPVVRVKDEHTPAAYNDPKLTASAAEVFRDAFGKDDVIELPRQMGGEDFGVYGREARVPGLLYRVGAVARDDYEASRKPGGKPVPPTHSSRFAPPPEPTIATAVRSMGNLVLALLARSRDD